MVEATRFMPSVTQKTPSELAHSLRDYARPDFGENISLLPFDRFRPDETFWWVCPDSDDSAYHYGKYIAKIAEPYADLFAGICFEKGIGSSAASFFETTRIGKSWVVRPSWIWNSFFDSLSDGTFDEYARNAQDIAGIPVNVIVSAATMNPPDPGKRDDDVYKMVAALPRQDICYSFDSSHLSLIHDHSDHDTLIPSVSDCRTLVDLAAKIKSIDRVDWIWVTVEFGFLLAKNDGSDPTWNTETVWSNACEPFVHWFR